MVTGREMLVGKRTDILDLGRRTAWMRGDREFLT
jgi:hypothetical protein